MKQENFILYIKNKRYTINYGNIAITDMSSTYPSYMLETEDYKKIHKILEPLLKSMLKETVKE